MKFSEIVYVMHLWAAGAFSGGFSCRQSQRVAERRSESLGVWLSKFLSQCHCQFLSVGWCGLGFTWAVWLKIQGLVHMKLTPMGFLVPNHFEWFGDCSGWSCPWVRVFVCPSVYKNCSIISSYCKLRNQSDPVFRCDFPFFFFYSPPVHGRPNWLIELAWYL